MYNTGKNKESGRELPECEGLVYNSQKCGRGLLECKDCDRVILECITLKHKRSGRGLLEFITLTKSPCHTPFLGISSRLSMETSYV